MPTLRECLKQAGFNFDTGVIVYQPTTGYSPGWSHGDEIGPGRLLDTADSVLDQEFNSGYGAPQCPRIFARDENAIYFPSQYDGASWIEAVNIRPDAYMGEGQQPTPYPGG